jgi:hypothetical protein
MQIDLFSLAIIHFIISFTWKISHTSATTHHHYTSSFNKKGLTTDNFQMTQYLAEEEFANRGMIGCTQPRRVAYMSVSKLGS